MADHYIDMVNKEDEVIGKELKSKKVELGFISRVSAILIKDSNGKFLVCKRAPHKIASPNMYDLAACGNVDMGEDYQQAAIRELKEELDLSCPVEMLDKFYQEFEHKGENLRFFCGVFLGHTDEEPKLNDELASFRKMTLEEIEDEMETNPELYCQGFINDFNQVKPKLKELN